MGGCVERVLEGVVRWRGCGRVWCEGVGVVGFGERV